MDEKLLTKIDELIEEYEPQLVEDTITFVNINSEQGKPKQNAPFGEGPRKMLDKVIELGEKQGFYATDYNVGVVSLALKDCQPDLGIWLHGDVVPAGTGWDFEPYNATIYKGCIIGRGATDNKGQLSAIFNTFKIFKQLGIELKYNPALYVGSNEETGCKDIDGVPGNPDAKGFINVCTPPKLSLVPDSSFPIGYGARGMTSLRIKSKTPFSFLLTAGLDDNPGLATAEFNGNINLGEIKDCTVENGEKTVVTSFTPPRHTSSPDPNGNMITKICQGLMDSGVLTDSEKAVLELFAITSVSVHGENFGLNVESKEMPTTTIYAKTIRSVDGHPELELRVRYPIEITEKQILENVGKVCEKVGCTVNMGNVHKPYVNDKENEVVRALTKVANEITGREDKPYINGTTYAQHLPNAYIYGLEGCDKPKDFKEGHGSAHGLDESVSIARLKRGMRIYARALLTLNEINW